MTQTAVQEIHMKKPQSLTDAQKSAAKAMLDSQYAEESKMVKGIFRNRECEGGTGQFIWKKYPQEGLQIWTLMDGETYDIPLGLARHINNDCYIAEHKYLDMVGPDGKKLTGVGKKHHRYEFIPTDFILPDRPTKLQSDSEL